APAPRAHDGASRGTSLCLRRAGSADQLNDGYARSCLGGGWAEFGFEGSLQAAGRYTYTARFFFEVCYGFLVLGDVFLKAVVLRGRRHTLPALFFLTRHVGERLREHPRRGRGRKQSQQDPNETVCTHS